MASRKKSAAAKAAEYSSLALLLPASTFVGYAFGWWLDQRFGTTWLSILFLILGSIGGFISLFRQIRRDSDNDGA
jgi:F0F1-type ATP synthase assembly protein I